LSDFENPYNSPDSPVIPEAPESSEVSLSMNMLQYLKETHPWLRFMGIVGYIGSGFLILMGIISTILSLINPDFGGEFGQFFSWLFFIVYLPLGVLMFFPAHFTFSFGRKLRDYQYSHSNEDLELAFKNNKSLWKFNGILCIIYLSFIPLAIIASIVVGIIAVLNFL
jgi:hypothetical protein